MDGGGLLELASSVLEEFEHENLISTLRKREADAIANLRRAHSDVSWLHTELDRVSSELDASATYQAACLLRERISFQVPEAALNHFKILPCEIVCL